MAKIYIVVYGPYGEYHIDSVWSSMDLAQNYINGRSWDYDPEIVEYDVDKPNKYR